MAFNYSPRIVTDGLVLYLDAANPRSYPGSGTTWSDLSRTVNNGVLTNGPTFSSANNGSIVFDGSNDFVNCGNANAYNITEGVTLGCWVYFNSLNRREIFIGKGDGIGSSTTQYWIEKLNNNRFQILISVVTAATADQRLELTDFTITNNQWYFVCLTYNRQTLRGYVNGVQNTTTTSLTNALHVTTRNFGVGRMGDLASLYLSGRVSNAFLYNRGLSAQEVLQNYNATKSRFGLT